MRRAMRGTDWLLQGTGDYAAKNDQARRPTPGTPGEVAYLDGWCAAALDDLERLLRAARGATIQGAEVDVPGSLLVGPGTHNTQIRVGNKPSVSDAQAPGVRLSNGSDTDRGLVAMGKHDGA